MNIFSAAHQIFDFVPYDGSNSDWSVRMGKKVVGYLARDPDLVPYASLFNDILCKRDSEDRTLHIEVCVCVCG
jgi:hypothetical protein